MTVPLTIGLATYDDFDGVYFTLQSLDAHHPACPKIVIDTQPGGCARTRSVALAVGARYLHRPDLAGTAAPRDALFHLARTPWVMVCDSHVLFEPGAIAAAMDYATAHPESRDLVQGPLVYDDGRSVSTHWRPTTPPGLWGVWDCDARGRDPAAEPFTIPAQGLGMFMGTREAWPGFHRLHRGFGGEEGYVHQKYRQAGGRAMCHPAIRWRHRFRHMEHGAPAPSYSLSLDDHVWNLLLTHRELGIEAEPQIHADFGRRLPATKWEQLRDEARRAQPLGELQPARERVKIVGVWYSNNAAPEALLRSSLRTIETAASATVHHDVTIATCCHRPVAGNPFTQTLWDPAEHTERGHAAIVAQVLMLRPLIDEADVVCFLEHDVLYPANYFDRVGDAYVDHGLATKPAPVISNLDYEGLNATGWLAVRERHEPLHQLSMRSDVALANLERCRSECAQSGGCLLEPQGDRTAWVRLPVMGMPAIHVNHDRRFTNHGEVCYERHSRGRTRHPHWGAHTNWWPGEPQASIEPLAGDDGCSACESGAAITRYSTAAGWCDQVRRQPSDCHEHMDAVLALARQCDHATELNHWNSPWLAPLMAGVRQRVVSVGNAPMPNWRVARALRGQLELREIVGDATAVELEPTDLLLTDTRHTADQLARELVRHAPRVRRWIVVHDTQVFGERGEDGGPGLLVAIREFLSRNPTWRQASHTDRNHGLTVLEQLM